MNEDLKALLGKIISSQKAYKSVKLIGDLLVVTLNDGSTLTRYDATEEDYKNVIKFNSLIKIKDYMLGETSILRNQEIDEANYTVTVDPYMKTSKTHKEIEDIIKKRVNETK